VDVVGAQRSALARAVSHISNDVVVGIVNAALNIVVTTAVAKLQQQKSGEK
jgi:hypothetical protein